MNLMSGPNALRNAKTYRSFSYVLVFLMMVCIVMTVSNLIHTVFPNWHAGMIAGILLLIVLDRLYTYQQLKTLPPLSSEWLVTLGTQWIVIALFSRFLLSYANGLDSLRADLSLLARGYIGDLFTSEFMITLFLALAVWALLGEFLTLLDEIGLDMKFALDESPVIVPGGTVSAHQRMVNLILSTGIFVVILTVLTRLDVRTTLSNTDGLPRVQWIRFSGAEAATLLYFVFGLALLSLSRLMSLQKHWNQLRIPVSSNNLPRQWAVYSLCFLLILAVVVSLLPAGDSFGFFTVVGILFGFLFGVLVFIARLVVALILLLFSLPFLLFGLAPPLMTQSSPPPMLVMPPVETTFTAPNPVWALIRSILLWGSLLAIGLYALVQFMRQHEGILATLRKSRVANWLLLAWQWLYRNADKTRGYLSRAITDGWQNIIARLEGKRLVPHPSLIRLRSLDPRRQIFFFYLAMVRRAAEQGLGRKPSETPSEYAVQLEKALPNTAEDVGSITQAFVQARYSRQEIDSHRVDHVKAIWGRIRHALQRRARREKSANK